MAYKNNFPKMYISTKCLQIYAKSERKVQKNQKKKSTKTEKQFPTSETKLKTHQTKNKYTSYSHPGFAAISRHFLML